MFGETEMLAVKVVSSDNKNRLMLPVFTNATVGDELIIKEASDYLEVISKKKVLRELKEIRRNISKYTAAKILYDEYLESIKQEVKVGSGRRITLTGIIEPKEDYRVVGAIDRIRIYKINKK